MSEIPYRENWTLAWMSLDMGDHRIIYGGEHDGINWILEHAYAIINRPGKPLALGPYSQIPLNTLVAKANGVSEKLGM